MKGTTPGWYDGKGVNRAARFVNILGLQSVAVNGTICQTYLKNIVRLGAIIPFRRGLFSFVGMLRDDGAAQLCDS